MSLRGSVATPDGKRRHVRTLFATIADRYDLIAVVLSYGQDRAWKRRLLRLAPPLAGQRVLDLATGTGDIAYLAHEAGAFDVVTTGYGLRNVPDLGAIDEIARVLAPGGLLHSLDFNRPDNAVIRSVYLAYLTVVGGALGWVLHRDSDTYRYIPPSIRQYPGAAGVVRLQRARGFAAASSRPVLGGLMAVHEART